MADLEGNYLQAPLGYVDAQPSNNVRRYKVGAGLLIGACFFWGIATTSVTIPALQSNGEASSLLSFAKANAGPAMSTSMRSSRSMLSLSMRRDNALKKLEAYGISPSPVEKLALTAIAQADRIRDVSMRAEGESGEPEGGVVKMDAQATEELNPPGMDEITGERLRKLGKAVELKAQDMAGVTAPLGFFDPLGFATDCAAGKLLFYREVELKHGRVGMLAALGFLVGENFHPLFGGDIDVPSYVAFQQTPLQTFWGTVLAAIAIPEVFSVFTFESPFGDPMDPRVGWWSIKPSHKSGDFGFDPLGLKPKDPAEFKELQTKELNNGRLAMIAAAGMIAQELATGQKLFG